MESTSRVQHAAPLGERRIRHGHESFGRHAQDGLPSFDNSCLRAIVTHRAVAAPLADHAVKFDSGEGAAGGNRVERLRTCLAFRARERGLGTEAEQYDQ